ncbi:TRAP transporter large permease [Euzebya rosea]|uniref:TRAP transporter large permease n=1 Tax=Euzebya rosea TaxID=2052804 RepID=UPI0013009376|nr:TRAP transporter large permease [Euzebya rosea]
MDPILVLIVALVLLVALIATEVPVAFSLLTSGAVGLVLLRDAGYAFNTVANTPYSATAVFTLTLIPMFVIMGMLVVQAGIATDVYGFAARTFARMPGGLGLATVAACAGFAAVTGSSAATVATIGRISITEMRRHGYSASFAAGIVGAAGTLGILIPPSVVLIVYGTLSGESVGQLLIAGIVPGVLSAVLYGVLVMYRQRVEVSPSFVFEGEGVESSADVSGGQGWAAVAKIAVLFSIVVGGIYSGVFTATESGAVAAFAALVLLVWTAWRRPDMSVWGRVRDAIHETTAVTSMIFMLLIGGGVFTFFMASGGYARDFATWIVDLPVSGIAVVIFFLLMMIPLGMVLDGLSIMLITVPLMHPVVVELGYDGVWFAILVVKMIELGLITPPVGINVYVVAGASPDLTVEDAFKGVLWFGAVDAMTIAVLFAFPALVTYLPGLIG